VTPGLRQVLTAEQRFALAQTLRTVRTWRSIGCDGLRHRRLQWLSASLERVCYYAGSNRDGDMTASVFYAADWRVAHLEINRH
jgi:hypothetical protein